MFNVLPDILKNDIRHEYRLRWLITLCCFVVFVEIVALVLLFPSWIVSYYKEGDAISQTNIQSNSGMSKSSHAVLQTITDTNQELAAIQNNFTYPQISLILQTIDAQKTKDISVKAITYQVGDGSVAAVTLSGISNTREALVTFVKNLQGAPMFTDVTYPVSNLAKDKDIEFMITLNAKI